MTENTVKDVVSSVDIKITPPTRQNTEKDILQESEKPLIVNQEPKDTDKTNEIEEPKVQSRKEGYENSEDISGSCEILDEEAYGDVIPSEEIDTSANDDIPLFTIVKENIKHEGFETSKHNEVVSESKDKISNMIANIDKCDSAVDEKLEASTAENSKDETDPITKDAYSDKNSMPTDEEKDKGDDELLNLSPSILNNDNAHSAFEISTIEYV